MEKRGAETHLSVGAIAPESVRGDSDSNGADGGVADPVGRPVIVPEHQRSDLDNGRVCGPSPCPPAAWEDEK